MKMLAIYNGTNKKFRHDGDEFQREARDFFWLHSPEPDPVFGANPCHLANVRDGKVRAEIRKMTRGLDVLAIFDHGTPKGLPRMRESYKNVKGLAETIAGVTDKITIILYACSCGKGWWWNKFRRLRAKKNKRDFTIHADKLHPREGYAPLLASELGKLGVEATVWAHLTWGHCCRLPHVALVENLYDPGCNVERKRFVAPGTPEWKQWKADMKTDYRFKFWR